MKGKPRLLIVDDEAAIRRILQVSFEKAGYEVVLAEDAREALQALDAAPFACVLTDVTMPGISGYELLREVKVRRPDTAVVIMTAFGTIPQAIQAIRDGAFEYVTKPFDLEALKKVVAHAVASGGESTLPKAKPLIGRRKGERPFIAESPKMRDLLATIQQVAESRATVLVTGESGVGKEVVARSLHSMSSRHDSPFVAVSCAALPETLLESELFGYEKGAFTGATGAKAGRFEMADHGTLFLDEIGEIPMSVQVKLLRVLQEREFERLGASKPTKVDVRLVTATNRDLREAVDEGIFRLDLMYRLQVIELHIPPLRERVEDIVPLSTHFLERYCRDNGRGLLGISDEARELLERYAWPGNVRELENTMERAVVLSSPNDEFVSPRLLPSSLTRAA